MIKAGRLTKTVAAVLTCAMVAVTGVAGGTQGVEAASASKQAGELGKTMSKTENNVYKQGITWWNVDGANPTMLDGQWRTFKTKYTDVTRLQDMKFKFSNARARSISGNRRQYTFKITVKPTLNPKKVKDVKLVNGKIAEEDLVTNFAANIADGTGMGGNFYFGVLDQYTGTEISNRVIPSTTEYANAAGNRVVVNYLRNWTYVGEDVYYAGTDSKGRGSGVYVKMPKKIVAKVRVTFPDDYNGICIGIGGSTTHKTVTNKTRRFWNGQLSILKTPYVGSSNGYDSDWIEDENGNTYYSLYNSVVTHLMRLNPYDYSYYGDNNFGGADPSGQNWGGAQASTAGNK